MEAASYYVVAEALTNVAKYAGASSAHVHIARVNGRVVIEVADDGAGGADPSRGSGLRGLADRLAALDGTPSIESPAGVGTAGPRGDPARRHGRGVGISSPRYACAP